MSSSSLASSTTPDESKRLAALSRWGQTLRLHGCDPDGKIPASAKTLGEGHRSAERRLSQMIEGVVPSPVVGHKLSLRIAISTEMAAVLVDAGHGHCLPKRSDGSLVLATAENYAVVKRMHTLFLLGERMPSSATSGS